MWMGLWPSPRYNPEPPVHPRTLGTAPDPGTASVPGTAPGPGTTQHGPGGDYPAGGESELTTSPVQYRVS
jgi:hypothetical protein